MFIKKSEYQDMQDKIREYSAEILRLQHNNASELVKDDDIVKYKTSIVSISPKSVVEALEKENIQDGINSQLTNGVRRFVFKNRKFIIANKEQFEKLGYEIKEGTTLDGTPTVELL